MGTVIERTFTPLPPRNYNEDVTAVDVLYVLEHEGTVEQARLLFEAASEYLFAEVKLTPNHDEIDRQCELLSTKSVEDICALMIGTTKEDWVARPEYFGALTLEYQRRLDHATYFASRYGA